MESQNNINDYNKVSTIFFNLEEKYNLFNYSIDGIFIWKLIRLRVFTAVLKDLDIYERTEPLSRIKFIFWLLKRLYHAVAHSCLNGKRRIDVLIFDGLNFFNHKGEIKGIYTFSLIEELNKTGILYEVIDTPNGKQNHAIPFNIKNHRSYIENLYLFFNIFNRSNKYIKNNDIEFCRKLSEDLKRSLNIDIDVPAIAEKAIRNFKLEYRFYLKLLTKRGTKRIYLICSYGKEALIAAARETRAETIELQHGIMTSLHLGYNFPSHKNIHYFPDRIMLFGKYWKDIVSLPLEDRSIEIYGFPYLEEQLMKYAHKSKIKNQILFLSTDNVGRKMTEVAIELAKALPEFKIVYKLHPVEFNIWKKAYPILSEAIQLPNFTLIDSFEQNLYALLFESETVIGVSSTAIYEALAVNCRIILLNLPSVENLIDLVEKNYCEIANTIDDLKGYLLSDSSSMKEPDRDYFFKLRSKEFYLQQP